MSEKDVHKMNVDGTRTHPRARAFLQMWPKCNIDGWPLIHELFLETTFEKTESELLLFFFFCVVLVFLIKLK